MRLASARVSACCCAAKFHDVSIHMTLACVHLCLPAQVSAAGGCTAVSQGAVASQQAVPRAAVAEREDNCPTV